MDRSLLIETWGCLGTGQGQELGYFQYGGSTVVTIFRRGAIKYDADLLENSRRAFETLVKMGASLGFATKE
jgi:phosphatidylserine decarboxylase